MLQHEIDIKVVNFMRHLRRALNTQKLNALEF